MGHTELLNYELDIGDEPITELCKSDGDGEVTSERQFALCVGTADVLQNKCVAVVDLYDNKWKGLTAVLADVIGQALIATTNTPTQRARLKVSGEPTLHGIGQQMLQARLQPDCDFIKSVK